MQARARRFRFGLFIIGALVVFAVMLAATGTNPAIAVWYAAFAGAVFLAVMAIWSRSARHALAGLVAGAIFGGVTAGGLLWNEAAGSGWEDLVRAIAIMSGVALGAIAGAFIGWLVSLRRRQ